MKITIEGVLPFDGEYELDLSVPFNGRELHLVKALSGVRLGEIEDALAANDYDVLMAITAITLTRGGKLEKSVALRAAQDILMEAPAGAIRLDLSDVEAGDDADPPELRPSDDVPGAGETSTSFSEDLNGTGDARLVTIPDSTGARG